MEDQEASPSISRSRQLQAVEEDPQGETEVDEDDGSVGATCDVDKEEDDEAVVA